MKRLIPLAVVALLVVCCKNPQPATTTTGTDTTVSTTQPTITDTSMGRTDTTGRRDSLQQALPDKR